MQGFIVNPASKDCGASQIVLLCIPRSSKLGMNPWTNDKGYLSSAIIIVTEQHHLSSSSDGSEAFSLLSFGTFCWLC
jgi:hypothetical protein